MQRPGPVGVKPRHRLPPGPSDVGTPPANTLVCQPGPQIALLTRSAVPHGGMKNDRVTASSPEVVSTEFARIWWKSLMANAVALVGDAAILGEHGSCGRAHSLLVLAMEELAKARWLYKASQREWSKPLGLLGQAPSPPGPITLPDALATARRPHSEKLRVAEQFASGLAGFWYERRRAEYYELADLETFDATAKQRNLDKQAGLYVDRFDTRITSPLQIPGDGLPEAIERAAQVIEMQLIEDHTRQQDAPDASLIDSVQDLHWAILPYAHPQEFAEFLGTPEISEPVDGGEPPTN